MLNLLRHPRSKTGAVATVIVAQSFLLWASLQRIKTLKTALAARPAVSIKTITQTRVVRGPERIVRGPERIVERLIEGKVVERVVYRDRIVTDRGPLVTTTATEGSLSITPIPLTTLTLKTRYLGIGLDPFHYTRPKLRLGITFHSRLDLGVVYDTTYAPLRGAFQAEAAWRF